MALSLVFGCFQGAVSAKEVSVGVSDNLSKELGIPLYCWGNKAAPQAVIVAIHGATLHGTSYSKIADDLSKKGYTVFAPDLRGFGAWYHNSKDEDAEAKQIIYSKSADDLHKLLIKLHALYPGKPVFLMGESVGANMAIRLLAEHPDCADGMILSGTAIKQRLFFGPHGLLQFLTVCFVDRHAQLDITPYIRSRVSESPKITDERVNDPLGRTKMDVVELFKTRFFNKDCLKLLPQLPSKTAVLVLEGSNDRLFYSDDVKKLMSEIPCEDKTLHVLKGRGHINLETVYLLPEVVSIVEDWLAEKSTKFALRGDKSMTTTASSSIETAKSAP